jgi:predicted CXXCH cytochrome family protein
MQKILLSYIFFIFLLCVVYNTQAAADPRRNPNSAKACAICHFRWIDTFFVEGRGSDLVDYQAEKVVATYDMCFSCHDGSVMDSRARLEHDTGHALNKPVPSQMKVPDIFPLDKDGSMECATCHTAHGVQGGPDSDETIFMRTSNNNSAMCRMCHPGADGGRGAGNHPAGTVQREIPENLVSMGAVAGRRGRVILCETCHAAHGSPYESLLIRPAGNSLLCLDCHRDKNIFAADGSRKPFHVINVAPKTAQIPEELINKGAQLGYNGVVTCLTCHKVHDNKPQKQYLLIMRQEKSTACLTCHPDKEYVEQSKHNLLRSAPGATNLQGRTVAEGGICSACHLPHKPARKLAAGEDFTTGLCLSCHSKGNIAEKVIPAGYTHPLNVSLFEQKEEKVLFSAVDTEKNELTLPLFSRYNVQDKEGEVTCSSCHATHGLPVDSAKREAARAGDKSETRALLRKVPPALCRECHHNKFRIADSKHDLRKIAPEQQGILKEHQVEPGLCSGCHLVHGSERSFLWGTKESKATGGEKVCVGCHQKGGLAGKKTLTDYSHPLNISPAEKGFTTALPLFDSKGGISKNGQVTCKTCHDPHRWNPLETTGEEHFDVEGNSQNSFLRLVNSPTPKLCVDCHQAQATIEKTDHDLFITAPRSKNSIHQIPAESGTCGVCHLVHNSEHRVKLWARQFGHGTNVMARMCNSCHSEGSVAARKVPLVATHPQGTIVNLQGKIKGKSKEKYLPLFDETTGEPVAAGNISCASCHNAHQWKPNSSDKGEGVNLEGNATNSFLRTGPDNLMCKDCHGFQSLLKFKFFHDPVIRRIKGFNIPLG